MLNTRKLNGSMITTVVLAVLVAIAVTAGATLAWFASSDEGDITLNLGGAVLVEISDEDSGRTNGTDALDIQIPAGYLVPGMSIYPSVFANIEASSTSALLRAIVKIEVGGALTDEGLIDTMEDHLLEQLQLKTNGWYYHEDDGNFYFVGNGATYSMYMTNVADLSELDTPVASKYAVAGSLLAPTGGDPIVKNDTNYALFTDKTVGLGEVGSELEATDTDQALLGFGAETTLLASVVTLAQDETNTAYATNFAGTHALVPFLVRPILIPIEWDNAIAGATITITIEFQAVQDFLVNPDAVQLDSVPQVLPTLANAIKVFDDAFPA